MIALACSLRPALTTGGPVRIRWIRGLSGLLIILGYFAGALALRDQPRTTGIALRPTSTGVTTQ